MPESLADAAEFGKKAQDLFKNLDPELKKGLSLAEFLTSITEEKLANYISSKMPKEEKKEKEAL